MVNTNNMIFSIFLANLFYLSTTFAAQSTHHCMHNEKWNHEKTISEDYEQKFTDMTKSSSSAIEGFAHALSLRKNAQSTYQKYFAEYWISRAFYQAGLYHIAYTGFQSISQRTITEESMPVQLAALECISRINDEYPSFKITSDIINPFYTLNRKSLIIAEALTKHVLDFPHTQLKEHEIKKALEGLQGARHFYWLAQGTIALRDHNQSKAIEYFSLYLKTPNPLDHLTIFKRHNDFVHLALGRSHYDSKKYSNASYHFQKIPKSSNLLTSSLTGFAWSEFMQSHYGKSIGTTMQFNTGELKQTYAPEAFMILAMSLNEICQFPSALSAIQLFFDGYKEEFNWLKNWSIKQAPLYSIAIDSLKESSKIPTKISSEWIRTPLFLGRQEEINLVFKENKKITELESLGLKIQQLQAQKIIQDIRIILTDYNRIKNTRNADSNSPLPASLLARIEKTKIELITYQRIKNAAPLWHKIVSVNKARINHRRNTLVAEVNTDLKTMAFKMLKEMGEVSENIQLIKMEIYNGATHDLVWQNANPDFKEVSKKIERSEARKTQQAAVWDWGDLSGVLKGNEEVWEDEVGAFQASLSDNCTNKEKYLALKKEHLVLERSPATAQTN